MDNPNRQRGAWVGLGEGCGLGYWVVTLKGWWGVLQVDHEYLPA